MVTSQVKSANFKKIDCHAADAHIEKCDIEAATKVRLQPLRTSVVTLLSGTKNMSHCVTFCRRCYCKRCRASHAYTQDANRRCFVLGNGKTKPCRLRSFRRCSVSRCSSCTGTGEGSIAPCLDVAPPSVGFPVAISGIAETIFLCWPK